MTKKEFEIDVINYYTGGTNGFYFGKNLLQCKEYASTTARKNWPEIKSVDLTFGLKVAFNFKYVFHCEEDEIMWRLKNDG